MEPGGPASSAVPAGDQPSDGGPAAPPATPEVAVRHLRASYDKPVFTDVTFTAPPGAVTIVSGPSGTGKTLLVRLLLGRQTPDRGEIVVGGRPVVGTSPAGLADVHARTAYLFTGLDAGASGRKRRHPRSVDDPDDGVDGRRSAGDNVRDSAADAERAGRLLADFGLDADDGRRADRLEPGVRRRLALACVFAGDPTLVLLDDPVAGLDPDERDAVVAGIAAARSSSPTGPPTTILTCWDLTTSKGLGDEFVTLLGGRVGVQRSAADALRFIVDDRDLAVHFAVRGKEMAAGSSASLEQHKVGVGLFGYDQRAGIIALAIVGTVCLIAILVLLVFTGVL